MMANKQVNAQVAQALAAKASTNIRTTTSKRVKQEVMTQVSKNKANRIKTK